MPIFRFIGFAILTLAVVQFIAWRLPWHEAPVTHGFSVCVTDGHGRPQSVVLTQQPGYPPLSLCTVPFATTRNPNGIGTLALRRLDDGSWEWETVHDSLSDPHRYRYRIEDGRALPVSHRFGGHMVAVKAFLFGLPLSILLWFAGTFLLRRRRKISSPKAT